METSYTPLLWIIAVVSWIGCIVLEWRVNKLESQMESLEHKEEGK